MQVSFLLPPEYGRALFLINKKDFGRGKRKMHDKGKKPFRKRKKLSSGKIFLYG